VIFTFSIVNLLQELETFRSEDSLHQYAIGGGPPIELCADDDVAGTSPDDLLLFDLILRDSVL
jgi:hypothetical protein